MKLIILFLLLVSCETIKINQPKKEGPTMLQITQDKIHLKWNNYKWSSLITVDTMYVQDSLVGYRLRRFSDLQDSLFICSFMFNNNRILIHDTCYIKKY